MNRTRAAGHAWLLFVLALTGARMYTAVTVAWWWCLPAWIATSIGTGLAYGCHRRAGREEQVARQLAALRGTLPAPDEAPWEQLENQLRKDPA